MKRKSFTLLEIIFGIVILSIIIAIALSKFDNYKSSADLIAIKSDLLRINLSIKRAAQTTLLKSESLKFPSKLDEANALTKDEKLFNGYEEVNILEDGLISTDESEKRVGFWIKISPTNYKIYINKSEYLTFKYESDSGKFGCLDEDILCNEVFK